MRAAYYLIPSLRAEEFRAHAGAYIVGVPQPTSMCGLVHALVRRLAARRNIATPKVALAYGLRDWSGFGGIGLSQNGLDGIRTGKRAKAAPIDDRVRASVTLTLLIEMVLPDAIETPKAEEIVNELERMRLQGASLLNRGKAQVFDTLNEAAVRLPKDAFFLVDARSDMESALEQQPCTWKAMLSLIERPRSSYEYKPRWVPALVGWRALHEPAARAEMRDGAAAHAMAEPVLGVARFMASGSFRRALKLADESSEILWQHSPSPGQPLYVAKGVSPYVAEFEF